MRTLSLPSMFNNFHPQVSIHICSLAMLINCSCMNELKKRGGERHCYFCFWGGKVLSNLNKEIDLFICKCYYNKQIKKPKPYVSLTG